MLTASSVTIESAVQVFVLCYFAVAVLAVYGTLVLASVAHVVHCWHDAHAERVTFDPPTLAVQPVKVYSTGNRLYQYEAWPIDESATFESVTRHQ